MSDSSKPDLRLPRCDGEGVSLEASDGAGGVARTQVSHGASFRDSIVIGRVDTLKIRNEPAPPPASEIPPRPALPEATRFDDSRSGRSRSRVCEMLNFDLIIEARDGTPPIAIVRSPAGDARLPLSSEDLERSIEAIERIETVLRHSIGRSGTRNMRKVELAPEGERLFRTLFPGSIGERLARSLGMTLEAGNGLRVRLLLDLSQPTLARLSALPLELIFHEGRYLCLGKANPFVRTLDAPHPAPPTLVRGRLKILLAIARPDSLPDLLHDEEVSEIERTLKLIPDIEVEILDHATPRSLRRKLLEQSVHVLHFLGHGEFDPRSGEGALVFESEEEESERITGKTLATILRDLPSLRLAVLNACDSGRSNRRAGLEPFGGVASALVQGGLGAVVAMQFPITNGASLAFSQDFYLRLAAGEAVDAAVVEGRLAIHLRNPLSFEWITPVLYLRSPDGLLFEKSRNR
jgi:hypothetical protein